MPETLLKVACAICICFVTAARCALGNSPVKPHPDLGKFKLQHDPDKPLLSFYGGIGLWKLPDGRWTGYGVTSREQVGCLIQRCADNGIKRIYGSFQEEQYPSKLTPSLADGETDYIALLIELAHQNNIEVYADQPIFAYVEAKNAEFVKQNPHVFTRSFNDEADTHMLSAAYPEVRKLKRDSFLEWVANYPIDGLQLDFIRFPYYTYDMRDGFGKHGYDAPLLSAFRTLYGYDESYRPAIDDPRWVRMRQEMVTQFIRELRADLRAANVNLPIGVYNSVTFGRLDSSRTVLQDWETWEREALVDQHSPMILMSAGMSNLILATQSLMAVQNDASEVIGPIFLAEGFQQRGEKPPADMVRDAARRLIKAGCNSLWFCRASEIEEFDLWPVVKEISQWSISQIRAENFDPAFENLLNDSAWTKTSDSAGYSQAVAFRPISHLPVSSLTLSGANLRGATVLLEFVNGETETAEPPADVEYEWTFPVRTDFAKLVLKQATVNLPASDTTPPRLVLERDLTVPRGLTHRGSSK